MNNGLPATLNEKKLHVSISFVMIKYDIVFRYNNF